MTFKFSHQRGFGLLEVLVAIFILGSVALAVTQFQREIFREFYRSQALLRAEAEARSTLRNLLTELRSAGPADTGAYTIGAASSSALIFYSDADRDGRRERIQYRSEGDKLRRGVIHSTGNPATYDSGDETWSTAASALANPSAIFSYYDANYAGTSTPLALPINLPAVRLVEAQLELNLTGSSTQLYHGRALIRSLKDNL